MRRTMLSGIIASFAIVGSPGWPADKPAVAPRDAIILATTTSTQDSGLLDVLIPQFEQQTGIEVKVIAVGSGAALKMAETGNADAVLVHAPTAEKKVVDSGDLIDGQLIMHNDFVIVGPPDDPADVGKTAVVATAMLAIAEHGLFISRGDDSGTHKQELTLWAAAGIDPSAVGKSEETGQGMGATLNVADQKRAYTLTDRGTYLSLRKNLNLAILFQGDARLHNVYHAYVVNPEKHNKAKAASARALVEFLVSSAVQKVIANFGREKYGEPLFFPDALTSSGEK